MTKEKKPFKTMFAHFIAHNNQRGITLAGAVVGDYMHFGIAVKHPSDTNYIKKIGKS